MEQRKWPWDEPPSPRTLKELGKFTNGEATSPETVRIAITSLAWHLQETNERVEALEDKLFGQPTRR